MAQTVQEFLWYRSWFSEVLNVSLTGTMFTDSQAAKELTKHDAGHNRCKHIDIKYHFLREHTDPKTGSLTVKWIQGLDQLADILTKRVKNAQQFTQVVQRLMR